MQILTSLQTYKFTLCICIYMYVHIYIYTYLSCILTYINSRNVFSAFAVICNPFVSVYICIALKRRICLRAYAMSSDILQSFLLYASVAVVVSVYVCSVFFFPLLFREIVEVKLNLVACARTLKGIHMCCANLLNVHRKIEIQQIHKN